MRLTHVTSAMVIICLSVGQLPAAEMASAPTTVPATKARTEPLAKPATTPVTKPTTKLATKPVTKPAGKAVAAILFQFEGIDYTDVVRRFAQMTKKPLIGDLNITGKLTFFDSEPYTYEEALDTLNIILGMQGYVLRERGRFLQMMQVSKIAQDPSLKILRGLDESQKIRPGEVVTVVLPLKYIDATIASKAVLRMVSSFGAISPLEKGKGLVLTDRLDNIQRISKLLAALDTESLVERQLKTYQLKRASAQSVANILDKLFGAGSVPSRMVYSSSSGRYVRVSSTPADILSISFDEATNIVIVTGTGEKVALAEQMITKLDAAEGTVSGEVRLFKLTNARAEEVAATITKVFGQQTGTSYRSSRYSRYSTPAAGSSPVRVIAHAATNQVLVSARVDQMANIEKLIKDLDQASPESGGFRIFPLKVADAQQLAEVIGGAVIRRDSRGRMSPTLTVSVDPRTNALIVSGPAGDIQVAAGLIEQLDSKAEKAALEIHVVKLKAGNAEALAGTLMRVFSQQQRSRRGRSTQGATSLRVGADSATNSLIIAASPGDWPAIKKILDDLKASAEAGITAVTRVVPLKAAKAEELAATLSRVYATRSRRGAVPVVIAPSKRSNSLVISASQEDHQAIAALIKSMDVAATEKLDPIVMVRLESADATKLTAALEAMMPAPTRGQTQDVFVTADPASKSVLIRAPQNKRKMLEEMIAKLDKASLTGARETRIINLKFMSASSMASMISQLYSSPGETGRSRRYRAALDDSAKVIVTAAPGDRALIVDAPKDKIERIAHLVASLDLEDKVDQVQVRTYHLAKADASEVAASLARLFAQRTPRRKGDREPAGARPVFEASVATNQLMVAATPTQFEEIDKLVQKVESTEARTTRVFQLKFAKADQVVQLLQDLLVEEAPRSRQSRGPVSKPQVRIAALATANAVVVQGPAGKIALADQLIKTFDAKDAGTRAVIQIVKLTKAQAPSLADAINETLRGKAAARRNSPGAEDQVTVTAEPNSNSVIVRGPAKEVPAVVKMIEDLDKGGTSSTMQVRIYPLQNGEAAALANSVSRLFQDITRQMGRQRRDIQPPPFSIASDERTNSLVVSTSEAYFALVEQILKGLDKAPERPLRDVKLIWLVNANSADVASKIDAMFRDRRGADRPVVEADAFSNALTVIAKDADLRNIEAVIAKLDEAAKDNNVQVRVIPLTNARADRMAEAVKRLYGQMTDTKIIVTDKVKPAAGNTTAPRGGSNPKDEKNPEAEDDEEEGDEAKGAAEKEQPITIMADKEANALIISAPRQELDNIEALINQLMLTAMEADAEFRVFKITKAEPQSIARTLTELFNPKPVTRTRGKEQVTTTPPPVITVVADARTTSLIVRAKPLDFEIIEPLIKHLDQISTVTSEVRIFTLKNTDAADVARNLKELFNIATTPTRTRAPAPAKGKKPSAQDKRAEQVKRMLEMQARGQVTKADVDSMMTISANENTNSVIVSAPADAMKLIERIVQELDQSAALSKTPVIRTYRLKHAEVAATTATLRNLFSPKTTGAKAKGPAGRESPVLITGDEAGKMVIISAAGEKHDLIASVISTMDEVGADSTTVRVYRIEHADASSMAIALNGAMGRGRPPTKGAPAAADSALRISADRGSNALVVRASTGNHQKVGKLIAEMDVAPTAQYPVQLIALRNADASKVSQILKNVFGARATGTGRAAKPSALVIEPDRDSSMLMVRADKDTFAKISSLARQLDAISVSGQASRTVIVLKHAQASTVAAALTQAFAPPRTRTRGSSTGRTTTSTEDRVTVVAEPLSNSVIVTANQKDLAKVQSLLAKLDTETAGGTRREFLILRNAKATDLAGVLSKAVGGSAVAAGTGRTAQQRVVVAADAGSNALVMSGPAGELNKLVKMAMDLDKATATTVPGVYIIPLTNGEAVAVARMVRDLYNQQLLSARRARRSIEPLAVSADERANALVIAAGKEMYKQVEQWVKQVEKMKPARGRLRIITLEHADPEEVNKAIQQLHGPSGSTGPVGRRNPGAPAKSGKVETTVLPRQRAILISASDEDYQNILKLAKSLDEAAAGTKRQVRVFELKHANAARVGTALNQMFRAVARKDRPEDVVSVTPIWQTSAVAVTASKEKMAEVEHLIKELDKKELSPKVEFRIYRLVNALPTKILPVLQQMVAQVRQSMPGESIGIQADQRTRSIIVTARAALFQQLDKIIKTLDTAPAFTEADVIIIPLKHADAARLAAVLNEMLRPSATAQVTPEARSLQEQIRLLRVRSTLREKIPELDLTKPIKITADPAAPQGSNSLLVSSTPDNIKAMRAIVEIMDTVPLAEGVKLRLIHLSSADAVSVQQVLSDIFSQAVRLAGKPGTTAEGKAQPETATGKALTNPLSISVDLRTNTLVLAGQEETVALAEIIVKDLDRVDGKFATDIRLFRLKHADAAKLAPVLQSVFAESAPVAGTEGVRTQVTRLRTIIGKEAKPEGHTTKLAKGRPALVIQADTTTNILVVAARNDVMPLIADVIKTMDVAGAGSLTTVRIYPLVNADASRLRDVITGLYTGPNAKLVRDEDKPTITVDTRTNALVISASDKTFAMVSTLLKRLDTKTPIELRDIRIVLLKSAEAAGLAATLQKMMDARVQRQASLGVKDAEALRMVVIADDRTNCLIVGGSAEGFKLVKDLAEQLDGASPALGGQIQLMALKHGNAGTLAAMLSNLFDQRYQAARTPDVKRQRPIILPDLRANLLLVAANADDSKILKALLAKMDVELKDPAVQLVVIPMKHNDAGVLGPTISSIFQARLASMTAAGQTPVPQDRVDVATDALSNSLVISASKENLKLIHDLLKKVDVEPSTETGIVRMYLLQNCDAQRVATMLSNLVSQGLYKPGIAVAGPSKALVAAREKVSIAVDARTNVLIVSASKENFAVIEQIIKRIDSSKDFGILGDVRIYTLKHADATRLAPTLQQFFRAKRQAEIDSGGAGRSLPVSIIPDARTNTLLVAGSRESFKAVEVMIGKLDGEKILPATDFNVFYLKNATAAALQPTIQKLFDQRVTRDPKADRVTVIADSHANALIVGASAADMKAAASLVEKLDVPADKEGKTVHLFPLKKADASQVAETIRNLYKAPAGAEPPVSVSVDERMNAIVISAGKADVKRISELIKQLDSKSLTSITEIRVFPLRNADAEELAKILTDTLTTKPTPMTTVSPNRQTLLQFVTKLPGGKKLIETALQEGVLITPDRRANSLVVSAPIESIPLLSRLIKAIDSAEPRIAEIRVFSLKNADAGQMAEVLQQLFRLEATEAASAKSVRYTLVTTRPAVHKAKPAATFGSAEQYALTVTVDVRTNSLLIGGTKQYVELAGKVIEELDSSPAQERLSQVYRLRNAQAADIEAALRNFLDQERQRLVAALGTEGMGAAQRLLEREVAVVAETATNRLLLSASPKYFKTIEGIIQELDQAPPQVLIQTLIAEVTLDDEVDVGIDWNFSRLRSVRRRLVAGTDFGIEAAIGGAQSGFGVSITAGDLTFFLRALQSQGRLEVLSRPQILASDNQEGRIDVGQRVPFITNSRITDEGATINTIEYQDVGIILTVTPRINIDGFVRLEVEPVISEIAESTVAISETVDAIIVNRRSAKTTVTVQDGHTIIIGGLITTHDERREDKVPILGDIPILGLLFRATEIVKERTELLIVLTPHILLTTGDADRVTSSELKRLEMFRQRDSVPLGEPALDPLRAVTPREPKAQTQPVILDESGGDIVPLDLLPKLRQLIRERQANRKKDYEALLKKQMELNKAKGKLEPEGKKKADK